MELSWQDDSDLCFHYYLTQNAHQYCRHLMTEASQWDLEKKAFWNSNYAIILYATTRQFRVPRVLTGLSLSVAYASNSITVFSKVKHWNPQDNQRNKIIQHHHLRLSPGLTLTLVAVVLWGSVGGRSVRNISVVFWPTSEFPSPELEKACYFTSKQGYNQKTKTMTMMMKHIQILKEINRSDKNAHLSAMVLRVW